MEEIKEIRYLGYILQKNDGAKKHIMERRRKKGVIAMKKTWSIEERIFKEDYERRMKMFEILKA